MEKITIKNSENYVAKAKLSLAEEVLDDINIEDPKDKEDKIIANIIKEQKTD